MVIGLEAKLVHKRNCQQAVHMAGAVFPPPAALSKAYEHHIGKALHSAAYLQLHWK